MYFSLFFILFYLILSMFFFCSLSNCSFILDFFLFTVGGVDLSLGFVFDWVSLGFFGSVSFISGLVFFYSMFYMAGTVDFRRFHWLVFGFVFSMFLLVFSGSFLMTLVGWDGLGLISFCLVIFYSNHSSLESGLVTVFSNRVGDVFFLGTFLFYFAGGSFNFNVGLWVDYFLFFCFMFLGAITKSAQLPFSAWLPAAMAAPTPVSSLVHSSTLVTAGVYVLLRFFYVFLKFDFVSLKLFFIVTLVLAGVCANLEKDFKKIVAMSTLSQLGLMLFILSVGLWSLTFLHMIIHAFFKSMLFLSTGSMMVHFGGSQESRIYGGDLFSFSALLFFVVSSVCLMGFPFYIGFYSKDFIILSSSFFVGVGLYLSFLVGCVLTVFYSFRLMAGAFSGIYSAHSYFSLGESVVFIVSVFFLFLKGWLLGGVFYWVFLFDSVVFFEGFDVLAGLFLMFSGLLFYKWFSVGYRFSVYFFLIGFSRWFSGGGSSHSFWGLKFHKWDFGWLEMAGGQGVYGILERGAFSLVFLKLAGLGLLLSFVSVFLALFF